LILQDTPGSCGQPPVAAFGGAPRRYLDNYDLEIDVDGELHGQVHQFLPVPRVGTNGSGFAKSTISPPSPAVRARGRFLVL
jgi:hypothetical protein